MGCGLGAHTLTQQTCCSSNLSRGPHCVSWSDPPWSGFESGLFTHEFPVASPPGPLNQKQEVLSRLRGLGTQLWALETARAQRDSVITQVSRHFPS